MVVKKYSNKKKLIRLISGIIILFLAVGGSFLIYKNNSDQSYPKEKSATSVRENPPSKPKNNLSPKPNREKKSERVRKLISENEYLLKTNPNLVPVPDDFIGELLEKGYNQAGDMRKLFDWKLNASDIPDLNPTKRIGVIKTLSIIRNKKEDENDPLLPFFQTFQEQKENCDNLVIMVREMATEQNDPVINIDGRIFCEGPEIPYLQEIIKEVLTQETGNPNKWEVSCLFANSEWFREGKSSGIAFYLALLSALRKKPLPNDWAATGELAIKEQKVLAVGGLKGKVFTAFNHGVKNLVLPQENSSLYQKTDPWIVFEEYEKAVPPEIREKMTVHWTENCQQLSDLIR